MGVCPASDRGYRALRDMEAMGWVSSTWDTEQAQGPRRRIYRLTAQGDQVLGDWVRDLRGTRRQIDHLVETYDRHMEEGDGEHHGSADPGQTAADHDTRGIERSRR